MYSLMLGCARSGKKFKRSAQIESVCKGLPLQSHSAPWRQELASPKDSNYYDTQVNRMRILKRITVKARRKRDLPESLCLDPSYVSSKGWQEREIPGKR